MSIGNTVKFLAFAYVIVKGITLFGPVSWTGFIAFSIVMFAVGMGFGVAGEEWSRMPPRGGHSHQDGVSREPRSRDGQ